jgi:phosphotriesterase-related protein
MTLVQTYRGPVEADDLGSTLMHEHLFVRDPAVERGLPDGEWNEADAIEAAVRGLQRLDSLGVRTVVDLTVPGLGRDVALVSQVASRIPINLVAATGWYAPEALPLYFRFHGPGRLVDGPDPLIEMFVRDIEIGIEGTAVRAGMLKVVTDEPGVTADVTRVMTAAAIAHQQTGVPITTHSHPATRNGLIQQAFFRERGVPLERVIIGHSGDTEDLDYLRALMDAGSTIGMDRFGMVHVLPDDRRVRTVISLLRLGYADRMILSHDAAFYSHVTPPSWRATAAPSWNIEAISHRILPMLREAGATPEEFDQMLVLNPRRLLDPGRAVTKHVAARGSMPA